MYIIYDDRIDNATQKKKEIMSRTIKQNKCLRCGHLWWPRTAERPRTCPKCRSPYWDKSKLNMKKLHKGKDSE